MVDAFDGDGLPGASQQPLSDLAELRQAWSNEKAAPDILPCVLLRRGAVSGAHPPASFKTELVARLLAATADQARRCDRVWQRARLT
jgi:hypothetical protein